MTATPTVWDPALLWNKALSFAERASTTPHGDGTLYSCLALELIARAALTAIHPALNADPQNEGAHLMYACGVPMRAGQPKSIPVHAVFARLEVVYPDFKTHRPVCEYLTNLRNEELHTGATPFLDLDESKWLADYYAAVSFLCERLQKDLEDYLGDDAEHARKLVLSRSSSKRADVKKRIAAQKTVFDARSPEDRLAASEQAKTASRFYGSATAECPACGNVAILGGDEIKRTQPSYLDGQLLVTITYATTELRCHACGLQLRTVDECAAGEIAPRFLRASSTDLHELHQDQEYIEYDNM